MIQFGKGWRRDSEEQRARRPLARALLGGAPARLPSAGSVRSDEVVIRNQRGSSACVGMQMARATDLRLSCLKAFVAQHSPIAAYTMGREEELGPRVNEDDPMPTIEDNGSSPSLVVEATTTHGLPLEADWPLPDNDIDLEEVINTLIPFDILEKASALHPIAHLIDGEGESRIMQIKHAITMGYPVIFGTEVDMAFEKYDGTDYVKPCVKSEGGHMLGVDGYDGDEIFGWNSWSEDWGNLGYWKSLHDFILEPRAGDFYAIGVTGKNKRPIVKEVV